MSGVIGAEQGNLIRAVGQSVDHQMGTLQSVVQFRKNSIWYSQPTMEHDLAELPPSFPLHLWLDGMDGSRKSLNIPRRDTRN
jgi:hypothetical protein